MCSYSNILLFGVEPVIMFFNGECTDQEVQHHVKQIEREPIDSLIAVGGGKCLDAGKCIGHCVSVPVIMCPTVASTDAPCSACSVIYTPEGAFERPWFFPESPALVLVDTGVVIRAPLRFLVAGIGDAMSTYYEARTCFLNPKARTMVGARPTAMAFAIAELGAKLLFENGVKAIESVKKTEVNEAVENVIEANTLLSGIGFESGGLAASHGIAQVFPVIPFLHDKYMHGEMVALGVLVHKCLERDEAEARRVASFFAQVGLPVHLRQLSLDIELNAKEIKLIIDEAMNVFFIHHEPFEVTSEKLMKALLDANALGMEASKNIGDDAYRRLHPEVGI
ncbi:glycerol dehydrogenase [Thermodesulfobacteriota bacterium]